MASSDFIPFAVGNSANVLSQAAYAALTGVTQNGFVAGIAPSVQVNKVWRQSSIMSAVLAQFIADRSGQNAVDDGTITTLLANLKASAAALNGDATQVFSVAPATAPAHALQLQQAQGMVGTYNGFTSYAVNTILSRSDVGQLIGASSVTLTLPLAATWAPTAERGDGFTIASTASVGNSTTVTVNTTGGTDHINLGATSVTTLVIPSGQAIRITRVSSVTWLAEGIAVGANIPLVIAPAVAPNQAVNFSQVSGVVGQTRNLVMNVATASATATMTADEIIVETALGGLRYCLPSFNETINLATTGAGGMDTGAAPVSGYVALYAIWNPTTLNAALLATNAVTLQGNVYGGAHMAAGYTASALVGVWPTDASGHFVVGDQYDRHVSTVSKQVLNTSVTQASPAALNIALAVPMNAKSCDMALTASTTVAGALSSIFYTSQRGTGQGASLGANSPSQNNTGSGEVYLSTPQVTYYILGNSAGTATLSAFIAGYKF